LAAEVRQANPRIKTSMQVRTEGDVGALAALVESLRGSLDGVSILTSPETIETAKALMVELRPSISALPISTRPMRAAGQSLAPEEAESTMSWFWIFLVVALGIMGGVIAGVVIGIAALLAWNRSKTRSVGQES
jgi:hypothetical protein